MSTPPRSSELETALAAIPADFRKRIISGYVSLRSALADGDFETATLRVGKFCESLLRFLQHHLTGTYIPFGSKITNLLDECAKLERLPQSAGPENLRIIMTRALVFAYTLRNKRGVGHVGGDVDANEIDGATAVRVADWCLCELIRFFHAMSLEEAQALLDAISVRQLSAVWSVGGKKRVLEAGLDYKSQVLLLLYGESEVGVPVEDLFEWVEYSRMDNFKKNVLTKLHKERLVEYDHTSQVVMISPKGAQRVEDEILPKLSPSS